MTSLSAGVPEVGMQIAVTVGDQSMLVSLPTPDSLLYGDANKDEWDRHALTIDELVKQFNDHELALLLIRAIVQTAEVTKKLLVFESDSPKVQGP